MSQRSFSLATIILAIMFYTNASMFNSQPQFTVKTVKHKSFDNLCLVETFKIKSGNIADCLEHCLENCRCQSFQICQNTKCQLCSSHKEENSSLLHDEADCIYATYEMRDLTETFQKLDDQCSGMSCLMKYNCCSQQSNLCPENKTCKPINSQEQPWKRFTCECPDGYHGNNCSEQITSCAGYLNGPRKSGMYKVMDSENALYEVYCDFDFDGAWTLVQSYSFANRSLGELKKPLSEDSPISENALTWSGYRISKPRMKSIKNDSNFLLFTCDYEKYLDVNKSDYIQLELQKFRNLSGDHVDVLEFNGKIYNRGRGKIAEYDLRDCEIRLHQGERYPWRVYKFTECAFAEMFCTEDAFYNLFGKYERLPACVKELHSCVQHANSTTQLWFGTGRGFNTTQLPYRNMTSGQYRNTTSGSP